ncbi:hypothetical protein [Embleya sp. NPDC005971]|uniref:DUF6197 family protein n=1 Tax=Embleya sp. NPDC005971 TaxID=3156724 RepID=UPI0033F8C9D0
MTTTNLPDFADVFRRAAEVIRRNGWTQETLSAADPVRGDVPAECAVCADGALRLVITGAPEGQSPVAHEAERAFIALVQMSGDPRQIPMDVIATWNDAPERTADEVIAAFETAAVAVAAGRLMAGRVFVPEWTRIADRRWALRVGDVLWSLDLREDVDPAGWYLAGPGRFTQSVWVARHLAGACDVGTRTIREYIAAESGGAA